MFQTRLKLPAAYEVGPVSLNAFFRFVSILAIIGSGQITSAQVDSSRRDFQLAYNQQLSRQAPPVFSAGPHLEEGAFLLTNAILFLHSAPARFEGRTRSNQIFLFNTNLPTGLVEGERLDSQSNFQGERVEPSLLGDVGRFDQSFGWRIGEEGALSYRFRKLGSRLLLHCGQSFKPPREAFEGERCFGLLFRFDLGKRNGLKP